MTTALVTLGLLQAGFLWWAAANLGDIFLQPNKGAHAWRAIATFAPALFIAWYGPQIDLARVLCGIADCFVLVALVGAVRFWAGTRDIERIAHERETELQLAAAAAQAARAEAIRSAARKLESHTARKVRAQGNSRSVSPPTPNPGTTVKPSGRILR
jgi:hypothetical protein